MMRLCNPNRAGRFAKDTIGGALPDTLVTCQLLRIPLCMLEAVSCRFHAGSLGGPVADKSQGPPRF
jgi:hypothetical protein